MKIAITDIETTGLDPLKHEIIEIGCIIFDSETLEGEFCIDIKLHPERIEDADAKALEVNGYTKEKWNHPLTFSQKDGLEFFAKATEGCHFMAHNVTFDWSFIEASFKRHGVEHTFNYHHLDTLSMCYARIPHHKVASWSLKTLCTFLGIPPEPKVHTALNGATCAYEVYKTLMS